MKLISWNVNGLRACVDKGFMDFFKEADADVFCIQESKLQAGQIDLPLEGYHQYWNYAEKKGYSGTALFSKQEPLSVTYGIGIPEHDKEGRVITAEFADFYVVTVYTPNSQRELTRLSYRMEWEAAFLAYINGLNEKKPVIFCGDLNVAHKEIDLKNPKTNRHNAGFTDEERGCFDKVLESGYIDTFRYFYPDAEGVYSWWSYMFKSREKNAGWRIDYFVVSRALEDRLEGASIHPTIAPWNWISDKGAEWEDAGKEPIAERIFYDGCPCFVTGTAWKNHGAPDSLRNRKGYHYRNGSLYGRGGQRLPHLHGAPDGTHGAHVSHRRNFLCVFHIRHV